MADSPREVKTIFVWVCPTSGCPDYYGAPGIERLHEEPDQLHFTGPKTEDRAQLAQATGSPYRAARIECPSCRLRGRRVVRQLHQLNLMVRPQLELVDPPTLPPLQPAPVGREQAPEAKQPTPVLEKFEHTWGEHAVPREELRDRINNAEQYTEALRGGYAGKLVTKQA